MSCCGGGHSIGAPLIHRPGTVTTPAGAPRILFRYEGERPLVVVGRATGITYRFARHGDEVAVDLRDRPSVGQVPRLREIRIV